MSGLSASKNLMENNTIDLTHFTKNHKKSKLTMLVKIDIEGN